MIDRYVIGSRVKAARNHWLRPGEEGELVAIEPKRGSYQFLIQFPRAFEGGGIEGDKLYLESNQFEVIAEPGPMGEEAKFTVPTSHCGDIIRLCNASEINLNRPFVLSHKDCLSDPYVDGGYVTVKILKPITPGETIILKGLP